VVRFLATNAAMIGGNIRLAQLEHFLDMEGVRGSIPLPPTI
jgi:hypothetical protein